MKVALALVALMLLPLVPIAEAAGPEARGWSPYATSVEVASIALAGEGTTIFASVRAPPAPSTGTIPPSPPGVPDPSVVRLDSVILDHDYGFARAYNVNRVAPDGVTHVAVSRDGTTIAALQREIIFSGTSQTAYLQLLYARIAPGGNWSAAPSFQRNITLGTAETTSAVGLALSDNGGRVAVLLQEGTNYAFRGWSSSGASLDSAFELRRGGTVRDLAANGDLSRMVVVGQFPHASNQTYGGALVHQFAQSEAIATYFDSSANNTDVRAATISRDGATVALGGGNGQLVVFHNARDALNAPSTLALGAGGLSNLSMSDDGSRLASAAGNGVAIVNLSGQPTLVWNATVSGQTVSGVALNRTGALIVVGTSGSGGGVHAFSDVDSTLLWSIPGDTRGVAINADGTRVAYALRTGVAGVRIPRLLTMDLVTGGKVAPTQIVTVPGTATVSVNLRNDGAALERVVFDETSPDVVVRSDPPIVTVRPGTIVRANLTIDVAAGLAGQRIFNVTARSLTSGAVDNVTLSVVPRPTLDVKLSVNTTDILAQPGQPSEFLVTIANNGTGDAGVVLAARQTVSSGPEWNVSLAETQLTALRGTRTSVKVVVTPPASATNGTAATIDLTLQGQDVFDTARVSLRINPELKVEVNTTGATKFIEPGKRASYNVTVTNIGSLPRSFDVFYAVVNSNNRNWGVDMAAQVVRLEPLATRTFPITITAPADALPQEFVAVRVTARSIPELQNETVVEDNVTLYGRAVEPRVTTTTTPSNGIPFATPLAAVVVLLFAALLSRRRAQ